MYVSFSRPVGDVHFRTRFSKSISKTCKNPEILEVKILSTEVAKEIAKIVWSRDLSKVKGKISNSCSGSFCPIGNAVTGI